MEQRGEGTISEAESKLEGNLGSEMRSSQGHLFLLHTWLGRAAFRLLHAVCLFGPVTADLSLSF